MTLFGWNAYRHSITVLWVIASTVAFFLFLLVVYPAIPVQAQQSAIVNGKILNGTEGALLPPEIPVALHAFSAGLQGVNTLDAVTDASGAFRFDDVPVSGEGGYAVAADYQGKTYSVLVGRDDLSRDVELTVYEATRDVSVIEVNSHLMAIAAIDESNRVIEAVEVVSLTNGSDRTLVPDLANAGPGRFSFLRFSLPENATDFDIQSDLLGGEIIPVGTGFAVTSPVAPGEHYLRFSYRFPYEGTTFSYRQNLLQGVGIFRLLVPESLGPIQAGGVAPQPLLELEDGNYAVWQETGIPPGQGLTLALSNLPQPGLLDRAWQTATRSSLWAIAIPSGLGAVLAAVLLYGGIRHSPRAAGEPQRASGVPVPAPTSQREQLVRQMALLDRRFDAGELDDETYRSERTRLRHQALSQSPTH